MLSDSEAAFLGMTPCRDDRGRERETLDHPVTELSRGIFTNPFQKPLQPVFVFFPVR